MVGCVQEESIPADMDPITLFQFFDGFCLITVLSTLDFVFLISSDILVRAWQANRNPTKRNNGIFINMTLVYGLILVKVTLDT